MPRGMPDLQRCACCSIQYWHINVPALHSHMPAAGIEAAVAERRAVRERMLAQPPKASGWAVKARQRCESCQEDLQLHGPVCNPMLLAAAAADGSVHAPCAAPHTSMCPLPLHSGPLVALPVPRVECS